MQPTHKSNIRPMKTSHVFATGLLALPLAALALSDLERPSHDRTRPLPPVVQPGLPGTPERAGTPPSDAIVLFNGTDLSAWVTMDGNPARWLVTNGYFECVKGGGDIRTFQNFGDCQLHLEWATPAVVQGSGQGRGNSGVLFGLGRYEVQVLDSYENATYADGSAGAIYGQYPPLVNACRPPGQWQTYDIIYFAPRFEADGRLRSPARMTVLHNGVLIHHNAELTGPTGWLERAPYVPHPEKLPIVLQDHGNPVRFRNIWVRELGRPGKPEFTLPTAMLDRYVGQYEHQIEIWRAGMQLGATIHGVKFDLFAESPRKFFAKRTDIEIEFLENAEGRVDRLTFSVGGGLAEAKRVK